MDSSSIGDRTIAPCTEACPSGIDVPRYIRHIRDGRFDEALAVIYEKIPFPAVCGYACAHPCESVCSRMEYDEPVAIRLLKRAAWEKSRTAPKREQKISPTGKRVAVIGAGPCGLTAAYYLSGKGHGVSVFEALPAPGGLLRYGIPEYRLPNKVLEVEIAVIQGMGVEIITNTPIESPEKKLNRGYDVVLVAVGAWNPLKMGVEGENRPMVIDGISFLREVNTGERSKIGGRVIVVGGGNTAVDVARTSVRLGSEVLQLYRRTRKEMTAGHAEVDEALEEGVKIKFLTTPIRVRKGKVVCIRMTPGPLDPSGRPTPLPVEGSEFTIDADVIITAVGESPNARSLNLAGNVNGTVKIDPGTLATSHKGVFAAGDAVSGPSSIIEAIAQGRLASISMDKFLGGNGIIGRSAETDDNPDIREASPRGTNRLHSTKIPLSERLGGFDMVEQGYSEQRAVRESGRCLSCDIHEYHIDVNPHICKGCGYCKEVCHQGIFQFSDDFNPMGFKPAVISDTGRCVGCLKCLYVCPDFAIRVDRGS